MRPSAIQFLSYFALSSTFIFIPLFAKELGATDFELGLIGLAYGSAIFFSSYTFGRASDLYGRKLFLSLGLAASSASFLLQIFARSPQALLLARFVVGLCVGIYPPALIAYVAESRKRIGKFAAYGSLGMCAGTFIGGAIGIYWKVFALGSMLFLGAFLLALTLEESKHDIIKVPLFPAKVLKENLPVYLAFFFRHLGASAVWIIFPIYLSLLGADKFWIGATFALNASAQFAFMQLMDRFKSSRLVALGLLGSGLTFSGFFLAQNFYQVFLLQLLLGFSWAGLYVGALKFVTERRLEKATGAGLLYSTRSLSVILGPFLGGALAELLGYKNVILFAMLMCSVALAVFGATLGRRGGS